MTKKNQILAGILFGMPLGAIVGIWVGFTVNLWAGIAAFALVFVLSGWGLLKLAMKQAGKQQALYAEMRDEIRKTAELKLDGLANYEASGKLFQGRLFLTGEELIFAGKQRGGEEKRIHLLRSEIALATNFKASEYVTTGLRIRMKDGRIYSFIVEDPDEWIEAVRTSGPVQPGSDPIP